MANMKTKPNTKMAQWIHGLRVRSSRSSSVRLSLPSRIHRLMAIVNGIDASSITNSSSGLNA